MQILIRALRVQVPLDAIAGLVYREEVGGLYRRVGRFYRIVSGDSKAVQAIDPQ